MSSDISSIPNQPQNVTPTHHGGGGHGKKINKQQFTIDEDKKETKPQKSLKSKLLNVNPDAHSRQQNKQEQEKPSKEQHKNKNTEKQPLGLDTLEFIGQVNKIAIYTMNNIKNDQ